MLVVMATLDGRTTVETFLSVIHLEKYLDTFQRAGLLLADDFTHLDHDSLVSLGVAATGHRKRILRLVGYIQTQASREGPGANRSSAGARDITSLVRCQSEAGLMRSRSTNREPASLNFETLRNSSSPDLFTMNPTTSAISATFTTTSATASTEASTAPPSGGSAVRSQVKPVPKPRTVFNRRRTTPVHFTCPPPQEGDPPRPSGAARRLSQESLCFTDPLTPTTTDPLTPTTTDPHRGESSPPLDPDGPSPPVPPRLHRPPPPTTSDQRHAPSSSPPGRHDNGGDGRMEMVSNEIYCGGSSPLAATPLPPPRLSLDNRTPERNSCSTLSNNSSGSTRASTDDPEEEISPYCETVYRHSEDDRNKMEGREAAEDTHAEHHGSQRRWWARRLTQALHSGGGGEGGLQGYSTVGGGDPPHRFLSLPHSPRDPRDPEEDLTISPYASYTCSSERRPVLCGWLDKLSPQG